MVVVENLDEGLDLGPLGDLLLAHGGGHFTGVAVNACDQSVAVRTVSCAVIDVLQRKKKPTDGFRRWKLFTAWTSFQPQEAVLYLLPMSPCPSRRTRQPIILKLSH